MQAKGTSKTARILFSLTIAALALGCNFITGNRGATPTEPPAPAAALPTNTPLPVFTDTPAPTPTPEKPSLSNENFQTFAPKITWDATSQIYGVSLSPDAKLVALLTQHGESSSWLELWKSETGEMVWRSDIGSMATYNAVTFSPDGSLIATGTIDSKVRIWTTADGELVKTIEHHKWPVRVVAFSPDGTMIAAGASDSTARVWNLSSGMSLGTYNLVTTARDIAFSPDSRYLAVTANYVQVYLVEAGNEDPTVYYDEESDTKNIGEVAFSPDGEILIGAGTWRDPNRNRWTYGLLMWDFPFNKTQPASIKLKDAIEDAVISPDGKVMVAIYKDKGILLLIDVKNHEVVNEITIGPKLFMSYSADIASFVVVSTKTTVTIWGVSR